MTEGSPRRLWVTGLRRAWSLGGALGRWVADREVTGVVWSPAGYEVEDVADAAVSLVEAGARPNAGLFWDFAVADIRAASAVLADIYRASNAEDGFVAVWLDPARLGEPGRATSAVRELFGDVRRANVAAALAWTPNRAAVVEALVAEGIAVALSGVREASGADALDAAVDRGRETLRTRAEAAGEGEPAPASRPVFVLGADGGRATLGVELTSEFGLFGAKGDARLPASPDSEQGGLSAAVERLSKRAREAARADHFTPPTFAQAAARECAELQSDEVLEDIWSRDHTIWKDDPTEISNRLGWLDAPQRFLDLTSEVTEFARKTRSGGDVAHVVVCGMGGSVFACEMFDRVLGGGIPLTVLDTTHPEHIDSVRRGLDLERTLFVVSSKSGTTVETRSHMEYFWSLVGRGDRFVAVTDPGTELATVARERGFLRVFENPPEIGGRFSGLSYFGLVPAALSGVDIEAVLQGARRAMTADGPGATEPHAPGVRLGAALGAAALRDARDKLTFVLPPQLQSLGVWTEQMLAESLGKEGRGILPILGEPLGAPDTYGTDRVFCVYTIGDEPQPPELEALEGDYPVIRIRMPDVKALGAEMYRWEMATAILGYLFDINPFDQPDVEAAKQRAREALQRSGSERPEPGSANDLLSDLDQPRYIALQAFVAPTAQNAERLETVRRRLRDRHRVPVTLGFGPRFLHSTGQLHKGGPNIGVFLQIAGERSADVEVPGMGYTFGRLFDAQADGDILALRDAGRPVARVDLEALEALVKPE